MIALADFLLARYAEEEALARAVRPIQMTGYNGDTPDVLSVFRHRERSQDGAVYSVADHESTVLLRYLTPERVLADIEAKREIVNAAILAEEACRARGYTQVTLVWPYRATCRALARAYADHLDFDPSWRLS